MKRSDIARRYVKAVFELVTDARQLELSLNELREVYKAFKEKEAADFIASPVISPDLKLKAVEKALDGNNLSEPTKNLLLLLAKRNRLSLLGDVVESFQSELDKSNGLVRGVVKSAVTLDQEERKQIENKVSQFFKKDVILNFSVDPKIVGGLVANVGSYTFDDSISSYLNRLNETLNRGAN